MNFCIDESFLLESCFVSTKENDFQVYILGFMIHDFFHSIFWLKSKDYNKL